MTATAIVIQPNPSATDGEITWEVWAEAGESRTMKFQRRTPRCVCDLVDLLAAKHPAAAITYVIR